MKTKIREQTLWLFALLGAILCMGVGYASINSITGEITGDLVAKVQEGVFITNVEYVSDVDANLDTSKINKYVGTLMQSTVELSKNPKSEITYKVTFYNNSEEPNAFINVIYDEEFYDNLNIIFEISGFNYGETIEPGEIKETYITFKYKDGVIPEIKVLNAYLDFKMAKFVLASEIFDKDGTNPEGLHIGDFVNYDAGIWTKEEINAIKTGLKSDIQTANGSKDLPIGNFQFGGFAAGSSRNGNATQSSLDSSKYDYVKDASTGEAIIGWRVFDIEDDGKVTLISAGNPEDYYHPNGTNYGYASEYILTGNINNGWTNGVTESANYQKRENWNVYVNETQKAESATLLTKERLDSWYSKYIEIGANTITEATFQKIYQEPYIKYQNMVENYSFFWFLFAYNSTDLHYINIYSRRIGNGYDRTYGVRPLVTLSSDVKFTPTKIGTKTVTGGNMDTYGGAQKYNCWGIK